MGAALLLGAYFTYLLITNDEQETMSRNTALVSNDSIPPLYKAVIRRTIEIDALAQAP